MQDAGHHTGQFMTTSHNIWMASCKWITATITDVNADLDQCQVEIGNEEAATGDTTSRFPCSAWTPRLGHVFLDTDLRNLFHGFVGFGRSAWMNTSYLAICVHM